MKRSGKKPKDKISKADKKHVARRRQAIDNRAGGQFEGMKPGQVAKQRQVASRQAARVRRMEFMV